ncbi:MAG: HAMP domain-containing histidine kinase [Cyclobacteriaceae bacterium]|nr:HAMP domain-containing histidine kinase [Cyclobacteriaceae bacterium]
MSDSFHSSLLVTYILQAVLGLALCFIFRHFSKMHDRPYLTTWSWAWLLFAVAMIMLGFRAEPFMFRIMGYWSGLAYTFFSLFIYFSYLILFLGGIRELIRDVRIGPKGFLLWIAAALVAASILTVLYSADKDGVQTRYFLRVGVRFFIASSSFIIAGLVLQFTKRLSGGLGHGIMSWSMILFGLEQGYYAMVVTLNLFSSQYEFPAFFGLVDLVMIFGIGFGMIIWLLEDERRELKKTNNELDRFVYSASHDLRSPIASMLGLVNLARMEVKDEKSLELIAMMEQRMKKLDGVIADFLVLSRSKKAAVDMTPVSLNQLIDEVVSDVKFAKQAPSIRLIYDREPSIVFQSDFGLMKTVLGNLFSNSVKYHDISKPDPFIRVYCRSMEGKVQIDVEDNGQGIRTEHLDRIFDMFYRASSSSDGTGLGLYIVRESLAKLKGSIFVKSYLGAGSTFTILLPQPG